jgi:hypothetical protein
MPRSQNPAIVHWFQGEAVANGKLYYYESGTTTPKATYADSLETATLQNAHPVILDSAGREPNIFYSGSAKQVLEDSLGNQVWERDPVGGESLLGSFSLFNIEVIYNLHDTVQTSNGKFYISLVGSNQGNTPSTSAEEWSEIRFIVVYNQFQTYSIGDIVQDAAGVMYSSQSNSNLANTPSTDAGTNWILTNSLVEGITKTAIHHFYRNR